jgi:hypothetical protein
VRRLLLELPLFLRRHAALVPPVPEAVSPPGAALRGEAAAEAAEVHRALLPDRPDTRQPPVGAEADTLTDAEVVILFVFLLILQGSAKPARRWSASLLRFFRPLG